MTGGAQRFGLLSVDDDSWLPLAGVHDALQAANQLLGQPIYEIVRLDARSIPESLPGLQGLVIAAGLPPGEVGVPIPLASLLAYIDARHGLLCGLGAGAAWLAHAGRLRGYRCTVHVTHADLMATRYPGCQVLRQLYEIDRTRLTSAAGTASLDLFIAWLGQRHGDRLSQQLVAWFGLDRLRAADERQQAAERTRVPASPKMDEAIALMQANLHEPLSTQDIADLVGVSRRQLERLFRQHLDALPARWYLEQRLVRAQRMLQQTSQSILQIGLGCGFSSAAHFSNAYRSYFGRTPRDERSARASAWRASIQSASSQDEELP